MSTSTLCLLGIFRAFWFYHCTGARDRRLSETSRLHVPGENRNSTTVVLGAVKLPLEEAVANTTAAVISYLGRGKGKDSCLTGNSRRHTTPTKRFLKHHSDSIVVLQKRKSEPINAQPS
jgi:hypothetical protein